MASQCVSNVVLLIQISSFTMMFLIIMLLDMHGSDSEDRFSAQLIQLRDICFRFLEEIIAFQFICIICVMLLVLCFELFQHVPDSRNVHSIHHIPKKIKKHIKKKTKCSTLLLFLFLRWLPHRLEQADRHFRLAEQSLCHKLYPVLPFSRPL